MKVFIGFSSSIKTTCGLRYLATIHKKGIIVLLTYTRNLIDKSKEILYN